MAYQANKISAQGRDIAEDTRNRTIATLTRDVVQKYLDEAKSNLSSNECISFANSLEDDAVQKLLGNHNSSFSYVTAAATAPLERCLEKPQASPNNVSQDEAKIIRLSIFNKLNAYETAFTSVELNETSKDIICGMTMIPFKKEAIKFISNWEKSTNRPYQLQNMDTEYHFTIEAADGKLCS
jgi:hypothetical protein